MKGQGKELEEPAAAKSQINKFNKRKAGAGASNNGSSQGLDQLHMSEKDINVSCPPPPPVVFYVKNVKNLYFYVCRPSLKRC